MRYILIIFFLLFTCSIFPNDSLFVIPIEGNIEPSLTVFIRRGIEKAKESDSDILFKINTFGGRVDSALQIASLIGSVKDRETIAYIPSDPEGLGVSWSAGALITFSCQTIYMAEGTSIGAAAPVYMTSEGTQSAEEKTVSAVRVQMASLAEKNGFPKSVALAMVDKDIVLYEVIVDGKAILKVQEDLLDNDKGKLICAKGKLLTLSANDMEYYGISRGTFKEFKELLHHLDINESNVFQYRKTIPDKLVSLITSTTLLSLLVTIGLITLYMAITSPGFGLLGAIGLICFSVVFLAGELLGTLGSLELLLFLIGVILLILEIFVIPGFGITGISGIIAIFLSIILSQQDFFIPKWEWQWDLLNKNILVVIISALSSTIIIFILMSLFPKIRLFRNLILTSNNFTENNNKMIKESNPLIKKHAIVITQLKPVGKIKLDNETYIAQSQGKFIEKGKTVVILESSLARIIVREVKSEIDI